jgi:hypothetical protein
VSPRRCGRDRAFFCKILIINIFMQIRGAARMAMGWFVCGSPPPLGFAGHFLSDHRAQPDQSADASSRGSSQGSSQGSSSNDQAGLIAARHGGRIGSARGGGAVSIEMRRDLILPGASRGISLPSSPVPSASPEIVAGWRGRLHISQQICPGESAPARSHRARAPAAPAGLILHALPAPCASGEIHE